MKAKRKPGRSAPSTRTKRSDLRKLSTPRVNVPRASKRPTERSNQKRSRG